MQVQMKTTLRNLLATAMLFVVSFHAHAQGTLVYDQESATAPVPVVGNGNADGLNIQTSPLIQSFTPSLSAIGFVQFEFWDIPNNGNNGATVYVNLWTGSPNIHLATLLGSTTPVYMPDGFNNNNLFVAGITNFFFSVPIALTAGQTYYLQPVVQSGDNPWDIIAIGDTYPNGQLYDGGTGGYFQPSTDLWFREGAVPEPTALALIGLGSLLAYTFKRRSKLFVLLLFTVPILSAHAADSVVQVTADAAGLTPVSPTILPDNGTFWVMTISPDGSLIESPYPFLPSNLSTLPIYSIVGDIFIVDDTGGQILSSGTRMSTAQAAATAQTQEQTTESLIELIQTNSNGSSFQPAGFTPMIYTNGLWLESWRTNQDNLWLRLHGTVGGDNYQLLSTTNLTNDVWNLGQILLYAADG